MGDGKLNQHHEDKKHTHNHPVIQVANIADLKMIKASKFIRNMIYFGIKRLAKRTCGLIHILPLVYFAELH